MEEHVDEELEQHDGELTELDAVTDYSGNLMFAELDTVISSDTLSLYVGPRDWWQPGLPGLFQVKA